MALITWPLVWSAEWTVRGWQCKWHSARAGDWSQGGGLCRLVSQQGLLPALCQPGRPGSPRADRVRWGVRPAVRAPPLTPCVAPDGAVRGGQPVSVISGPASMTGAPPQATHHKQGASPPVLPIKTEEKLESVNVVPEVAFSGADHTLAFCRSMNALPQHSSSVCSLGRDQQINPSVLN